MMQRLSERSANYPTASGLKQRLESAGYVVRWSTEDKLSERLAEGCELVVLDEEGRLVVPKIKDTFTTLTLIRRRR